MAISAGVTLMMISPAARKCDLPSFRPSTETIPSATWFSSQIVTKLRDWAVGQAWGGAAATLGQHCPQMTQRRCSPPSRLPSGMHSGQFKGPIGVNQWRVDPSLNS